MNRDQILRRNDEITAETDAVIRRGKEIVSKLRRPDRISGGDCQTSARQAFRA